jgi:glutamyl-tRNA reductase
MPEPLELLLVGTSHRHAPVEVRERLALRPHGGPLVDRLASLATVVEAVGLSTCNRCELYLVGGDGEAMAAAALETLAGYAGVEDARVARITYRRSDEEAAAHVFAVAAGLDSLVPGEAQILSQIRSAYGQARAAETTGPVLNRLFHQAIETGKRVRSETAIGEGGASVASVAVDLVRRRLGELAGRSLLVLGAGKVAELVAANLLARGATAVTVVNRDAARARQLAGRLGSRARAVGLDALASELAEADVVVTSTSSPEPLVTPALVEGGRARVVVDLGVPRDVEPAVGELPGVALFDIDDLEDTVRANLRLRAGEAERAQAIVAEEAAAFGRWLAALEVVPAITSLRALAEQIRARELERMAPKLSSLSAEDRERLDLLTQAMVNKLLHRPTVRLKELAAERASGPYAQAIGELFGLPGL